MRGKNFKLKKLLSPKQIKKKTTKPNPFVFKCVSAANTLTDQSCLSFLALTAKGIKKKT